MKGKIVFGVLLLALVVMGSLYLPYPRAKLSPIPVESLRICDRNGLLLREMISSEGGLCHWVELDDISPYVAAATIAAEDRYFFLHPGINVFSMVSAALQNIRQGEVVSGASTITQQLARNLYGLPRTLFSKLFETWIALRLEKTLSKEEILTQYLNRVCYGNMTYGIEAASKLYFDKSAADLSPAEAAFLASLPRSPRRFDPYRDLESARKRQKEILDRMVRLDFMGRGKWSRALQEPLNLYPASRKFRAPHFCDYVIQELSTDLLFSRAIMRTSLDYGIQEKVEILLDHHLAGLESKRITNAAVVVLDSRTSEILAMVGSRDFFDEDHDGQVNGALSLRQPGSTLKPFTYGLALERGMTAAHILEDREVGFSTPAGIYRPQNYDKRFHGPVRMRQALACSYNVPAVVLLENLGPDLLYQKLREMGFQSLEQDPGFYGVGLTLGNGEVTLLELVQAYAALARGGLFRKAESMMKDENKRENESNAFDGYREYEEDCQSSEQRKLADLFILGEGGQNQARRIFSPQTAHILTDMLCDRDARIPAFGYNSSLNLPFPCAVKTGTSKDCRDNWAVGYTPRYTVGVWVGNFDGKPMYTVSGVTGCGPLFHDVMLLLEKTSSKQAFPVPLNLIRVRICPLSGKRAASDCPGHMEEIFVKGTEPDEYCPLEHSRNEVDSSRDILVRSSNKMELKVLFPMNGDIFRIDPVLREKFQTLRFKASVPEKQDTENLYWYLNDHKVGESQNSLTLSWRLKPGIYRLHCALVGNTSQIRSTAVCFTVLR